MLSKEECKNTMLKMHNDGIIITSKKCKETFYKYGLSTFCITTHFDGINLIIHKFSDDLTTLQDKLEVIKSNTSGLYHDPF